jgi:hypothetical protein
MVLPYLKGFYNKVVVSSIWFHRSCVVIVFRYLWIYCDILYSGIWFLTSGIRALSLAGVVAKYFLFLQIFFSEKKKRAATFQTFSVKKLQKRVVDMSSSQKNTQFKKKISSETESGRSRY